jgi:hypothetical protein
MAAADLPALYVPFGGRKLSRSKLLQLLRRIYGPGIPWFLGSAYEGHAWNDAELILHELAHMTQFDFGKRIPVGAMEPTWQMMFDAVEGKPKDKADDHEVHAITVELLTSHALGLPLCRRSLVRTGARNCVTLKDAKAFDARVSMAERDPAVRADADQVLALIDLVAGGH